ncbi:MAG: ArsR family transcriptional regulator [Alphaproteobacteria bacterium]|nr:ArsR family transcriptional regulator [Alphaproteobacteria bacterium]MBU1278321.1 ArsR family transcriptional regulator [Alphaproteobacteria bacterium]MBU1574455.1 ArsR family transcriptional regulator [Alphaproteobacteria bacterium]MBU1828071.1 ArsR family transcriptional regulator [Alphaproteobacteria bacterium]MBU2244917.1 ArsR family transcriptional regulator [Alphaproteobacteria bacterium]
MQTESFIQSCTDMLDDRMFAALQDPARVAILRRMFALGRADISSIAEGFPQDRSVISRHIRILREAGIVNCENVGRQTLCDVDGRAILRRLEAMTEQMRAVVAACCPEE